MNLFRKRSINWDLRKKILKNLTKIICKQESIPVGCVPPAFVAGGLVPFYPLTQTRHPLPGPYPLPLRPDPPGTRPHWDQIPPVNRLPDTCKNITFPKLRLRAVKILITKMRSSRMRTTRLLTVSRSIGWRGGRISAFHCPPLPREQNGLPDRCKNITLPQTLLAGGKNTTKRTETLSRITGSSPVPQRYRHHFKRFRGVSCANDSLNFRWVIWIFRLEF